MTKSIAEWQIETHANATAKGWWDDYPRIDDVVLLTTDEILSKLMLIVSEISEALEDARVGDMTTTEVGNGKPVGFPSEIADVVIRCMDLCGAMGIDLEGEIERKAAFNRLRPFRHGKKLA